MKFFILFFCVSISNCIILDCTFDSTIVSTVGTTYHCDARVKAGTTTALEQVNGSHLPNKTTADVTSLWVRYQVVTEIPKNLSTFFPIIKAIYFLGTNLSPVKANDLKPFPNLIFFGSASNKQVTLDADLFKFTPKLRGINFYNTSLEHVGENLLKSLVDLQEAGFQKNPCIDKYTYNPDGIRELKENISFYCPPSLETTTVKPVDCKLRCSLNEEADELLISVLEQNEKIAKLESKIAKLELQIRNLG